MPRTVAESITRTGVLRRAASPARYDPSVLGHPEKVTLSGRIARASGSLAHPRDEVGATDDPPYLRLAHQLVARLDVMASEPAARRSDGSGSCVEPDACRVKQRPSTRGRR